jgi:hypothetical protein
VIVITRGAAGAVGGVGSVACPAALERLAFSSCRILFLIASPRSWFAAALGFALVTGRGVLPWIVRLALQTIVIIRSSPE